MDFCENTKKNNFRQFLILSKKTERDLKNLFKKVKFTQELSKLCTSLEFCLPFLNIIPYFEKFFGDIEIILKKEKNSLFISSFFIDKFRKNLTNNFSKNNDNKISSSKKGNHINENKKQGVNKKNEQETNSLNSLLIDSLKKVKNEIRRGQEIHSKLKYSTVSFRNIESLNLLYFNKTKEMKTLLKRGKYQMSKNLRVFFFVSMILFLIGFFSLNCSKKIFCI